MSSHRGELTVPQSDDLGLIPGTHIKMDGDEPQQKGRRSPLGLSDLSAA